MSSSVINNIPVIHTGFDKRQIDDSVHLDTSYRRSSINSSSCIDDSHNIAESSKRRKGNRPGRKPLDTEAKNRRTAQNRAAQRAFRERKERRMRELEDRVRDLETERDELINGSKLYQLKIKLLVKELKRVYPDSSVLQSINSGEKGIESITRASLSPPDKLERDDRIPPSPHSSELQYNSAYFEDTSSSGKCSPCEEQIKEESVCDNCEIGEEGAVEAPANSGPLWYDENLRGNMKMEPFPKFPKDVVPLNTELDFQARFPEEKSNAPAWSRDRKALAASGAAQIIPFGSVDVEDYSNTWQRPSGVQGEMMGLMQLQTQAPSQAPASYAHVGTPLGEHPLSYQEAPDAPFLDAPLTFESTDSMLEGFASNESDGFTLSHF